LVNERKFVIVFKIRRGIMDKVFLEFPTVERKTEALEYIQEFKDYNSTINGTGSLDSMDFDQWMKKTIDAHNGINIPDNRVAASTYFLVRAEDNRILGMVKIRHTLSPF
jgi:predicted acetyltransferase